MLRDLLTSVEPDCVLPPENNTQLVAVCNALGDRYVRDRCDRTPLVVEKLGYGTAAIGGRISSIIVCPIGAVFRQSIFSRSVTRYLLFPGAFWKAIDSLAVSFSSTKTTKVCKTPTKTPCNVLNYELYASGGVTKQHIGI